MKDEKAREAIKALTAMLFKQDEITYQDSQFILKHLH